MIFLRRRQEEHTDFGQKSPVKENETNVTLSRPIQTEVLECKICMYVFVYIELDVHDVHVVISPYIYVETRELST